MHIKPAEILCSQKNIQKCIQAVLFANCLALMDIQGSLYSTDRTVFISLKGWLTFESAPFIWICEQTSGEFVVKTKLSYFQK